MEIEGDEWKDGDKPKATPQDMKRFHTLNSRILLAIKGYQGICETYVLAVSPCGEYAKLALGGDMFFGVSGKWIRTDDCTLLSILEIRPQVKMREKASEAAWLETYDEAAGEDIG